ncbi:hypothetical protein AWN76_002130 [Rhodothermaceae bacterium RA]|nr:hypothetical protein AWN76_002130 [Rhodothermaceae bacterium RA]
MDRPDAVSLRRGLAGWLLAGLLTAALPVRLHAQEPPGRLALGLQVGDPAGVLLKLHRHPTRAYTLLASWDFDATVSVHLHRVREYPFDRSPLRFVAGPGVFTGRTFRGDGAWQLGAGALLGVGFYRQRFEVALQLAPRLRLLPDREAIPGYGIGLRYFLSP